MKITRILISLLALAFLPALASADDLGRVRMSLVQGDVQVNSQESGEWFPVSVNTPLREGDRLWVPPGGRSEIQVQGGAFARLDEATSFDFLALGDKSLQFYMEEGRAYINNRGYGIDYIQVDTPLSSIGCYDNAVVMLDVSDTGVMELSVVQGYAVAETRSGKIRVTAGNALHIGENLAADIYPLGAPDDWTEWNRERDRLLAYGRDSRRYLPDELDDYVSDFESNGRWLSTAEYGYVWTPSVAVSINWAPYRTGRWVWFGGNYVWISYEPWGWVPYHYGRWIFVHRVGWCWVPPRRGAVYWAPGYVAWVHTPTFVSWVPLAPGETYYGYGHYGPGSVNITNVTVNNTVILKNLRNVNVRNAVTVMHRDSFLHGRKADIRVTENPFHRRDVGAGPPRFKPGRAALAPVIKDVPAAKMPPPRIRSVNPELLRKERKLVRDERGSVFAPGRPAREMPAVRREAPKRVIQERKPERGDVRTVPGREYSPGRERQIRQREMIGPVGTDLPESGRERPPVVTQPSPRRQTSPTPAAEPRPGIKREDTRRRTAPVVELPGGTPAVTPQTEQGPRVYVPKRVETPTAPQPVAPTPVWRPPQAQQPQGRAPEARQPDVRQPQNRPPEARQPDVRQPQNRPPATRQPDVRQPGTQQRQSVAPPAQAPGVQQPRGDRQRERQPEVQRPVTQPPRPVAPQVQTPSVQPGRDEGSSVRQPAGQPATSTRQERGREESANDGRPEYRPQNGRGGGANPRDPYRGERGNENR